jgi:hypothetical protein
VNYSNAQIEAIAGNLRLDGLAVAADMMDAWLAERVAATSTIDPAHIIIGSYPPRAPGMHVGMPMGVIISHKAKVTASCDASRSQHINRDIAMLGLHAMLAEVQK